MRPKRRRCTQRGRVLQRRLGACDEGVLYWLSGLPGAGPRRKEPMPDEYQSRIIDATVLTSGIDQGRGYGGRHAPVMHERCDASRLGPTFELSGRRRQDARPGLVKMYRVPPARAWWPAVGAPLERGVRPRYADAAEADGVLKPIGTLTGTAAFSYERHCGS